ncbi:type VII secretion protein EccB [Peterkaempfera bronchialis]|uniref:type VII secretion protein EccB n=1 Tax=Peterkaempfera bronchialis TaxID=2126346 RepID=UPI003C30D160
MASRRDELNAYTFARRRTVGAFLQPAGGGNDEDAPRPVRAVVPSLVMAALVVAGFGMWGLIKPAAPKGWDDGRSIVVGKESTTRYVVLANPDKPDEKTLYPVLNMASAKLVLDADSKVTFVEDKVLDRYGRHGATIGIPYAPDKLPPAGEAGQAKVWTVCDRPGDDTGHTTVNQAVFVLTDAQAAPLRNPHFRLSRGNALYVQAPGPDGKGGDEYLVDATGTKHSLGRADPHDKVASSLRVGLFGTQAAPQRVTQQWLDTLADGEAVTFPKVAGFKGGSSMGLAHQEDRRVGRLMSFDSNSDGTPESYYVVGEDRLYRLSDFELQLFQSNPATLEVYGDQRITISPLTSAEHAQYAGPVGQENRLPLPSDWPQSRPDQAVNRTDSEGGTRSVVCSTFEGLDEKSNPRRSVWASTAFPASATNGSASAHVTPGTGLLYRAMEGAAGAAGAAGSEVSGSVFLLTETGLRYRVVANGDSAAKSSVLPERSQSPDASDGQQAQAQQGNDAQARLGYKDIRPSLVPKAWSDLVPAGPNLDTKSALQPQTS